MFSWERILWFPAQLHLGFGFCKILTFSKMKTASGVVLSWSFSKPARASLPSLSSGARHKATIVKLLFKPIPSCWKKPCIQRYPVKKIPVPRPKITDWNLVWGSWIDMICFGGIQAAFCLSPSQASETWADLFPKLQCHRCKYSPL